MVLLSCLGWDEVFFVVWVGFEVVIVLFLFFKLVGNVSFKDFSNVILKF